MTVERKHLTKLKLHSGGVRAFVGSKYLCEKFQNKWDVASYSDFSEFNRNGVVDRFIVQGLSMDDAIKLVLKLENEARKEVSCHTPTASAALSPDTTGSTNPTS